MVKYIKTFTPLCLVDKKRQEAFEADILAKEYIDKNSLYKCKYQKNSEIFYPVKDGLNKIYKNKCAYCETRINRAPTNIEHYRPKSIYYALVYSWSNLLPICDICNTKKSNKFEIEGVDVRNKIRIFTKMQYTTKLFNRIEKPKFIHPEIDNYEHLFRFNTKGEIIVYKNIPDSDRMTYTIKHSDLNENALAQRRAKVLQDFIQIRNELFYLFKLAKKHKNKDELNHFKNSTKEKIKYFFDDTNEFLAVRKYTINRLRFFFCKLDFLFIKFFKQYLKQYIKTVKVYS